MTNVHIVCGVNTEDGANEVRLLSAHMSESDATAELDLLETARLAIQAEYNRSLQAYHAYFRNNAITPWPHLSEQPKYNYYEIQAIHLKS